MFLHMFDHHCYWIKRLFLFLACSLLYFLLCPETECLYWSTVQYNLFNYRFYCCLTDYRSILWHLCGHFLFCFRCHSFVHLLFLIRSFYLHNAKISLRHFLFTFLSFFCSFYSTDLMHTHSEVPTATPHNCYNSIIIRTKRKCMHLSSQ